MNKAKAEHFAADWLAAWNAHDLPRVLAHYADDFEMYSPLIARIAGQADCRLQGKQAVGAYWAQALKIFPDLRFQIVCTMVGVNSVTIHYVNATGKRVAEVFQFNEAGLVSRAHAHYEL